MIYRIEPEIFEEYPSFCRGVVLAWDLDNTSHTRTEIEPKFRERIAEIETHPEINADLPRVRAWYDIYASFKLQSATNIHPSVGNLLRRIRKGDGAKIPFISTLVCISNLMSLTYLVPSGIVDADRIEGNLIVGRASGKERFLPFGSERSVSPEVGEIIYYDDASDSVLCRAWNSRGSQLSAVLPTTQRAIIDLDGLTSVISRQELRGATEELAMLVSRYCGGQSRCELLASDCPSIEVRFE